jgi:adenylate cyclase
MESIFRKIKENSIFTVGFIAILFALWSVATSSRGVVLTKQFYDPVRTTSDRSEAVIVSIDDTSLQALGAWPWDRSVLAKLITVLNQSNARAAVFDVLFLEPRSGDDAFKEALLHTATPVVLAAKLDNDVYLPSYFVDGKNPLVVSALANVEPDSDGKVREFPTTSLQNGICITGLAQTGFAISTFAKSTNCAPSGDHMFRYPKEIATYSLVDVINGKVSPDKLKDKVVFIGATSLDLMDHFVGISGEKIPGIYVHASIFTSLLNRVSDKDCSSVQVLIYIALSMFFTGWLLYRAKSLLGQVSVIVLLLVAITGISLWVFSYGIELPLPWIITSVFLNGTYITVARFIKERKKGEYIQSLFSKYVHKDVLKELLKSSRPINLEGEKRDMTILFSDLRGFTTFAESLPPEELTKLLNGYFSAMTPPILEEKGTIDKFIGDAVMAFWNAPLYVDDHTTHAVRAGLLMGKALEDFNSKHGSALAMGIGVHRGDVIVGNVGSKERVNYTVLGDAVNLTSRIEGLTKKYGVKCLITEEARNGVTDENIIFRRLDVITVKGKKLPTTLYEARFRDDESEKLFEEYEKAFDLYQEKSFDEAEVIFKKLKEEGDYSSEVMYERIRMIVDKHEWDFVHHWDEK